MMVTELAATVVLLLADALAFRHSLRERPRNAMFWVVVAMGTVVGGYLSFGLVWQTKTTRFY